LYTCGPTVYNFAHVGNLRAYIFADTLVRTLKYNFGEESLKWVMNITDVDDKTIRDSKKKYPELEPKEALEKFTCGYEKLFWEDMKKLNISSPSVVPHAANEKYLKEMQRLVVKIHEAGLAYVKDGSVYFSVNEYAKKYKYGQLVNLDLSSLKTGTRIDLDEYDKENVQDFVLWKGKKKGEPYWDFEMAGEKLPGRPGWHIECSAMGGLELGMPFDIHTGGEDLKFPHHEDEIAQNTAAFGLEKGVNFWMHNGMLMVEGKKMSKSLGNFYNLRDVEERAFDPLAFRYLCLMTHYRKPLDFSWRSLQAAKNGLNHIYNQVCELKQEHFKSINFFEREGKIADWKYKSEPLNLRINQEYNKKFVEKINDDLNTSEALAVLQEILKSDLSDEEKLGTVLSIDDVLGLKLHKALFVMANLEASGIADLMGAREKARAEKNWAESDRLREEIEKRGFTVEDAKEGMRVRKI